MKNYIQFDIDGKLIGWKLNIRTLKIFNELTGKDPFSFVLDSSDFKSLMPYVKDIFKAGVVSNLASKGDEHNISDAQIDEWYDNMSPADLLLILKTYNNPEGSNTKPSANGEGSHEEKKQAVTFP